MATVSKIPSRKRRNMRNARKSSQEAAGLLLQPRSCAGDAAKKAKEDEERDNWWRKRGVHAY